MREKLTYVSLFSSAGLGCYGFKTEGFECLATAEVLDRRIEVQRANEVCAEEAGYICGDLSADIVQQHLLQYTRQRLDEESTELTAVLATPPCQGISVANHKKKNELARNSLVVESLKLIAELTPRFFVLENVRGFLTASCQDTDGEVRSIGEAIERTLGGVYNILGRAVNLKDFGSPSSRTRTLVIGVRRDLHDLTPYDFFPDREPAPTLRELIGDLPRLHEMGEISPHDVYHQFRPYELRMRPWITPLKPGQSAFDNATEELRPHRIINGKLVPNKAANGDKYRRSFWDRPAPCVHTRNDILASQSTVHPEDDRVFSIRELSRMMGVPDSFRWSRYSLQELNACSESERRQFLKDHETNIRQCLGEGVPTPVFQAIAAKMRRFAPHAVSLPGRPRRSAAQREIPPVAASVNVAELENPRKKELAAYYTRQDVVYSLVSGLPDFGTRKRLRILEPSVGSGAFLPALIRKYGERHTVELHINDIDPEAVNRSRMLLEEMGLLAGIELIEHSVDFVEEGIQEKFDLIVGNPPFGKPAQKPRGITSAFGLRDRYALFLEQCLGSAQWVSLVIPKSFLNGPEFRALRDEISSTRRISSVEDYGEAAFRHIKIETIGLTLSPAETGSGDVVVKSLPLGSRETLPQDYLADPNFPSWLIYRNELFDVVAKNLRLGVFKSYRDRKLTRATMQRTGDIPVLRATNIGHAEVLWEDAERFYCGSGDVPASFSRLTSGKTCLVVPNLSYYTRAAALPHGMYVDGSAAVLVPVDHELPDDLSFYSSPDFFFYYRIARNYSTRSLNIDSVSSYYWGIPIDPQYRVLSADCEFIPGPKDLYSRPTLTRHALAA